MRLPCGDALGMCRVILRGEKLYLKSGGITMTFKGRLIVFLSIFCIAALMASSPVAQGKPEKPDKPGSSFTEWIEFTEDLVGGQPVDGCCPNAGPWPAYRMTLNFGSYNFSAGTYDGQLFINYYGAGRDQKYKVQFWWDYDADLGIEIIGGVINHDRKNKVLTVTFTNEECRHIKTDTPIKLVNFTLVRHSYNPD